MILRVDHLDLLVEDVNKAAELFGKMGFQEVRRTDHHGLAIEMRLPGEGQVTFEFHQVKEGSKPGLNHVALQVDDCAATAAELEAQGLSLEAPPRVIPATGRTVCNLRDSNSVGCRVQFTQ